jgi:hypothetical protein
MRAIYITVTYGRYKEIQGIPDDHDDLYIPEYVGTGKVTFTAAGMPDLSHVKTECSRVVDREIDRLERHLQKAHSH